MKSRTLVLFGILLMVVVGALVWFQTHQHQLGTKIRRGGMSAEVQEKFLSNGVDCQEIYELQGYEAAETLLRMFGLTQHEYYSLNPGMGMDFKPGHVICVRGIWGVKPRSDNAITWFWPAVAIVAAAGGFFASSVFNAIRQRVTGAPATGTSEAPTGAANA